MSRGWDNNSCWGHPKPRQTATLRSLALRALNPLLTRPFRAEAGRISGDTPNPAMGLRPLDPR